MRRIMELADVINEYVDREKPWELAKNPEASDKLQYVASVALEGFRLLTLYLKPVLPATAERVEKFLNCGSMQWDSIDQTLSSERPISKFEHLMGRVDREKQLDALLPDAETSTAKIAKASAKPETKSCAAAVSTESTQNGAPEVEAIADICTIDDFSKIDLRVARVVKADHVEGADKLIRLELDIGDDRNRQVFAGIKAYYKPEELVGKLVVMIANLAPRKMRFGLSEGMVLAASYQSDKGAGVYLVTPFEGAQPGMRLR